MDDDDCGCPLCSDDALVELIDDILHAAAQPGVAMTGDEFLRWLEGLEPAASPL